MCSLRGETCLNPIPLLTMFRDKSQLCRNHFNPGRIEHERNETLVFNLYCKIYCTIALNVVFFFFMCVCDYNIYLCNCEYFVEDKNLGIGW